MKNVIPEVAFILGQLFLYLIHFQWNWNSLIDKATVTPDRVPTELSPRSETYQKWCRGEIWKSFCKLFEIFTSWRSQGVLKAIVTFIRNSRSVLMHSHSVLVWDRWRCHRVLVTCPLRARLFHCTHTACALSSLRPQSVHTAFSQMV